MAGNTLFIGHSLIGQVMPDMFNSFMADHGQATRADAQIINGAPLRWNWDNGDTAQGVNARAVLPSGDYDTVVVTEAIPLDDQIQWNDTHGYAKRYADLAYDANPQTQFYLYETWHPLGSDPAAWRDQLTADLPKWQGILDHVNATAASGASDALLIPAGQAMGRLYDAIEAGEVPGLSSITALFTDDVHLNDTGMWFIAALHAEVIADVDAAALPVETFSQWGSAYGGPDAALAQAMNDVIDETLAAVGQNGDVGAPGPVPPQVPDPAPDTDTGDTPDTPPVGSPVDTVPEVGLGFGLSGIADYATASPFLDVFKSSRPFFGHETGRWGGFEHDALDQGGFLDPMGWPTDIPAGVDRISALVLTELPAEMEDAQGRYRVTWQGEGEVRLSLSAEDVTYGQNEAWFTYTPDGTGLVSVDILSTDPNGTGSYIRDISVVHERHIPAFEAGEIFNSKWISVIEDAHALRFMDWMDTNNSTISDTADAPQFADASWATTGAPLEVMIRLANETGTDPWFTLPHRATEDYMRDFITKVKAILDPQLTPYFEFSNEVWNWQFSQAQEAQTEGQGRFGDVSSAWVQNYAADAVTMARLIDDIYGANSPDVVKVIATQTGWRGLEEPILNAPDWVAEDPGNRAAPSSYFDAYAITGYFDGGLGREDKAPTVLEWIADSLSRAQAEAAALGLSGDAAAQYVQDHRYDHATTLAIRELRDGSVTGNPDGSLAELSELFAYHKEQADKADLDLVMYEGGTHIVGVGQWQANADLAAFFAHLNYTAGMGEIYTELLASWVREGGTLFNAFTAVDRPTPFGSWGHLRHLDDENARMDAVIEFLEVFPKDVSTAPDGGSDIPSPGLPLTGDGEDNQLAGDAGDNVLRGQAGDDWLSGNAGDDLLYGGSGWDVATYSGPQDAFTLTFAPDGTIMTDRRASGDGKDRLIDIEEVVFGSGGEIDSLDLTLLQGISNLSTQSIADVVELYIAYFDRAPAAKGLAYWASRLDDGMTLPEIAQSFFVQDETQATYAGFLNNDGSLADTEAFVTAVFNNLLGRDPYSAYWIDALDRPDSGITPGIFILAVLNGAKAESGGVADAAYLEAKTDIGVYFSAIKGLDGYENTVSVMQMFDGSRASVESATREIDRLHAEALDSETGSFLIELVGVIDNPFALV
ncbi:hypothetical protein Z945_3491 [Sulfitobacter noctilucae]|uniref:DUF4214 domain-containing protein n=1 Tax=Sulfitobacter noctilucae TaxID=1342302 RepID=UPI000699BEF2|nr:DUF4214 domain-containing protein [Sulfitobacter noctilucae]KIN70436.1 hypothetical protein Z945_3491 [Sulfitobacter noctilucae]